MYTMTEQGSYGREHPPHQLFPNFFLYINNILLNMAKFISSGRQHHHASAWNVHMPAGVSKSEFSMQKVTRRNPGLQEIEVRLPI